MERDEAISRLQQHEADLKRLGVEHLYMFGSTARRLAGRRITIPTLTCFSTIKEASSASLN
jgi:predicted nucleotidyltransferase